MDGGWQATLAVPSADARWCPCFGCQARDAPLTTRCLLQLLLWAKRGGPRRALSLCWHVRDQNAILKLRDMQRPAWGDTAHAALHRRRGPAGEQFCRHDVAASSWLVGLVVAALSRPDTYVTTLVRERVRSAVWVELLRVRLSAGSLSICGS